MFEQIEKPKSRSIGFKIMGASAVGVLLGFGLCGAQLAVSRANFGAGFLGWAGLFFFLISAVGLVVGIVVTVMQAIVAAFSKDGK